MGWQRVGAIGGGSVVLALVILYGTYEVQQEKFPEWLFVAAVVGGIVLFTGGIMTWSVGYVLVPAQRFFSSKRFRSPVVDKDEPDPNQWLLDRAREHAQGPEARLLILKAEITNKDLRPEQFRPWLEIGLTMRNASVCSIQVGQAKGHAVYKGNELPTPVESSQHSNKPPDHEHVYKLKIYVPQEITEALMEDIVAPRHKVSSLGFARVKIEVVSEGEYGCKAWRSLGDLSYLDVPD